MNSRLFCKLFLLVSALSAATSCDLPRDQRGTLERVKAERRVSVGLIESKPWVIRDSSGEPSGAEIELVKKFVAEVGAAPEWFWGSEAEIMTALEHGELDLVAGGLTEETLWKDKIGLTKSYFTDRIIVGSAASVEKIEGVKIAVERGDVLTAALVADEKAAPEPVENLSPQTHSTAAARDWRLEKLGYALSDIELQKDKHVLAVVPGENGWLVRIEEFLKRQRPEVKNLLSQAEVENRR